ncbi:MAG: methyl-accepting chemotaxis protein [Blautia sp.]|nr:methyl-accepting chemotaxis protein [Blautia sp.]MCM1200487.1 methyl-accepting chemotaxis protein [Bacteroides fragilis]
MKDKKENHRKKKGLGILPKMVLMCSLPMVILEVVITVYSINALQEGMQSEALNGLSNVCQSVSAAYEAVDAGAYHLEGEVLYKGEYCVTENLEVIDSFTGGSDVSVTLFYGDTRRATSLIDKATGNRIVGTKASDTVISTVLQGGKDYSTNRIEINGENYYAYYRPVKDDGGQIVGMVFAGRPSAKVDAVIIRQTASIAGIALVILLISIAICTLMVKGIVRVVLHAENMLGNIANGQLKIQLSSGAEKISEAARNRTDEIGKMVSSMYELVEKLQNMVANIKRTTENLTQSGVSLDSLAMQTSTTADEISHAVEDISKGAITQAEDIESATMQVTNIGEMIGQIVSGVKELDEISLGMKKADDESGQIISELSASNDKTIGAIQKIDASVHTTNESVGRIQEAVNLITAIASETSLLALNASIEAARAGEAGRGFAVVASQISKLSEDSNSSAKTIEDIITKLSDDSAASVQIMAEVGEIINEQQRKLEETKNKFRDVSRGIETSMVETEKIYGQTKECDAARAQVTDVIQNLSAVAQQNAASTEETNAAMQELNATISLLSEAAKDLKEIAQKLEEDVSFFKI